MAVEYRASALRDPFEEKKKPVIAAKKDTRETPLNLEGLVWNSVRPQAIINGTVVEVGSEVGGAKVLAIDRKGVKLRVDDREFYVRVKRGLATHETE